MEYRIVPLPEEKWKGTVVPIGYTTKEYYDAEISSPDGGFEVRMIKKEFSSPVTHTPEEYNFPDSLYQDDRKNAQAFGIVSGDEMLACIEFCPEEWTNRLVVTEMWASEKLRRQGVGTNLMNLAKESAISQARRAVILETQSCNVDAIAFYISQGFSLIGFDSCAYSNGDISRHEVRLDFGYFISESK
ncbi:MAG: GNAT family N-acetyltransferase [Eubacteriaceae bacterium]|nr:GNAT family N-acetyltransferase [Eubacteriaceae bacterium]